MKNPWRHLVVFALCLAPVPAPGADERPQAPPERALSAFSDDPARQFDFWIGRWEVNLRIRQPDLTFADSVAAEANIYSILDGKAILELWDSQPIKGYSLRYYDPARERWILWLDWPRKNTTNLSTLEGAFRHGRGEFRSEWTDAGGQQVVQRYAFGDITPFSLRWDDRISHDGGATWSENWRMEFSRLAVDPEWPIPDDRVPTFTDGGRCTDARYRTYEAVVGHWRGDGARLDAYRILDGCAVMAFLEGDDHQEFLLLTFADRERGWEIQVLDDRPGSGLRRYSGAGSWLRLSSEDGETLEWTVTADEIGYHRGERSLTLRWVGSGGATSSP